MIKCTWKNCKASAKTPQIHEGKVWANLCAEHCKNLRDVERTDNVDLIGEAWVIAQGGIETIKGKI